MLHDILVHLDGSEGDETRLLHAESIAREFDAFLTGIFLNIARIPVVSGYMGYGVGAAAPDYQEASLSRGDDAMKDLKERFKKLAPLQNEIRRFDVFLGEATNTLAAEGRTGDLFVCARPYGDLEEMSEMTEAVIFGAGRGVYLVPPASKPPEDGYKNVMLAWRNTKESARAGAEAMPFLRRADRVTVVMVDEGGGPLDFGEEPGIDIARHLSRHGCSVELRHLRGKKNVAETLLAEAQNTKAHMIVMGSYGHWRIRHWILGGVTRHVLANSPVPVLTAH